MPDNQSLSVGDANLRSYKTRKELQRSGVAKLGRCFKTQKKFQSSDVVTKLGRSRKARKESQSSERVAKLGRSRKARKEIKCSGEA